MDSSSYLQSIQVPRLPVLFFPVEPLEYCPKGVVSEGRFTSIARTPSCVALANEQGDNSSCVWSSIVVGMHQSIHDELRNVNVRNGGAWYVGPPIRPDERTSVPVSPHVRALVQEASSTQTPTSATRENLMNDRRHIALSHVTPQLLALIEEQDFEYGIETTADSLVRRQMAANALATRSWLNELFIDNSAKPHVLVGLLRIIAHMEYGEVYPEGPTIAVAALSHQDVEVKECGVRAFERWATLESLHILENLKVSTRWLQEYIDQVVLDLRKEFDVSVCAQDQ